MLETSEERVKLLKAGFIGKTVEKLYIKHNNFKIVRVPLIIEFVEFDIPQNKEIYIKHKEAIGCTGTVEPSIENILSLG